MLHWDLWPYLLSQGRRFVFLQYHYPTKLFYPLQDQPLIHNVTIKANTSLSSCSWAEMSQNDDDYDGGDPAHLVQE